MTKSKFLMPRHGMRYTRFNNIWRGIKIRCYNKKVRAFKYYGGRGIQVCNEWLKFINFRNDLYQSYLEHCKKFGEQNTSIDRIDNNGNYCKENCRWTTKLEQANNTRGNLMINFKDKKQSIADWSRELNINYQTLNHRYHRYKNDLNKVFKIY